MSIALAALLSGCIGGCPAHDACDALPSITAACGSWILEGGEEICGCPVTVVAAEEPVCTPPDPGALMSMSWLATDAPEDYLLGTWPATSCPTPEELTGPPTALGSLPLAVGNAERDWLELTWSPDGAFAILYERLAPGYVRGATLARCSTADEPGWLVERFVDPATSPFIRWGSLAGDRRHLYVMADDMYRLSIDTTVRRATAARGLRREADIVVLESAELLARSEQGALAFGDFDVSFEATGDGVVDRYAVLLSALEARQNPLFAAGAIYAMDLQDCRQDCGDARFCCRTALLVQGDTDYPDIPTNPGLSDDGALIALNRFTTSREDCPEWGLCAQEHVLRNPLADPALLAARCLEDATRDGFIDAIDCRPLLASGERFDEALCPDHRCCGQDDQDCSTCVTIGARAGQASPCGESEGVRERNYVLFFELDGSTWLGFRSTDLIGDLQSELHLYRVAFSEAGFGPFEETVKLPLAGFAGAALEDFGPGPWRRTPAEPVCR